MYSFNNDYSEGACEEVLEALIKTNRNQSVGYGLDDYCEEARTRIKSLLACESCDVHFLVGGTQSNQTIIAAALRPHEAVIAADSGHINVHETGAIEATGHKVLIASSDQGKVLPEGVRKVVKQHTDEHMVKPKLVYISNATEIGTVYTKQELLEIRAVCDELGLYLFMDGARLPMALVSKENDVTLPFLASVCDVFYLGGTKCGAMLGEAVVIVNDALKQDFRYHIKQRGGMLAKGRLLGIQFNELCKDDLYFRLARHANEMAQKLQAGMEKLGIQFFVRTTTNQIFPILENRIMEQLRSYCQFQVWEEIDEAHTAVRFVTSWACEEAMIDECLTNLYSLLKK